MTVRIITGDALTELRKLPDESVHCCVTSPPYFGLRDYGCAGQLGLEPSPVEYVAALVSVFREVRRVLRKDATLWLNIGDSYASGGTLGRNDADRNLTGGGGNKLGSGNPGPQGTRPRVLGLKHKDLIGIPWLLAFALRSDGWYLRQDIIWSKPNPMPESVTDRCTKAHEYLFLLAKSQQYHYDAGAIKEVGSENSHGGGRPGDHRYSFGSGRQDAGSLNLGIPARDNGRNKRSVWMVSTEPFPEAHFATFPPALIKPCILAGSPVRGVVLDPFAGSGTTLMVADKLGRDGIGIELNPQYAAMAERRCREPGFAFPTDIAATAPPPQRGGS